MPAVAHLSTQSIVNCTGNTTYNFGRDVVNNSFVNNYVQMQKQVRISESYYREATIHQVTGSSDEDDKVKYVVFTPKYLKLTLLSNWGQLRI